MRDFTDSHGIHWIVWSTKPWTGGVLAALRGGWLTFVSPQSRRRLVGIPEEWEAMTPEQLEGLCKRADPVTPPPTPSRGEESVSP